VVPSIFSGLCLYRGSLHIVMSFLGRMTCFVNGGLTVCSLTVQAVSCAIYLHRTPCVKKMILSFPYSEFDKHLAFLFFSILNFVFEIFFVCFINVTVYGCSLVSLGYFQVTIFLCQQEQGVIWKRVRSRESYWAS
jgi:hypothetical protein